MNGKKNVELFSAGCTICLKALEMIRRVAPRATVTVRDMGDPETARRAESLGVRSVPAVAIDGALADCCSGRGVREELVASALERHSQA